MAVPRIGRDRKAEMHAGLRYADLAPVLRAVIAVEHTAVILLPEVIRLPGAGRHEMRIVAPLRLRVRAVVIRHAAAAALPGAAAVGGLDHPGRGYGNMDMIRVARVDDDRMDARLEHAIVDTRRRTHPAVLTGRIAGEQVAAATLVIPQWPVEFPAVAAIVAHEQAAGDGAGIQPARLSGAAKGKIPDLVDCGGRVLGLAGRRCRVEIGRRQDLDDVARPVRILQRQLIFPAGAAIA